MAEEDKPIVKPPPPYQPIKYFLSSLNTFFGHHLVGRLRNDNSHPDNPNRIVGTVVSSQKHAVPAGVRKVIDVSSFTHRQRKSPSLRKLFSIRTSSFTISPPQTSRKQNSSSLLSKYTLSKITKRWSVSLTSWLGLVLLPSRRKKEIRKKETKTLHSRLTVSKKELLSQLKEKRRRHMLGSLTKTIIWERQLLITKRSSLLRPFVWLQAKRNLTLNLMLYVLACNTEKEKVFSHIILWRQGFRNLQNCLSLEKVRTVFRLSIRQI